MRVERRGFLFGLGAVLVAQPKLLRSSLPTIYGDGVNDDWEGLQSLLIGKPVRLPDGDTFAPGRRPEILGGKYLVTRTLHLDSRSSGAVMKNCEFVVAHRELALLAAASTENIFLDGVAFSRLPQGPRFTEGQHVFHFGGSKVFELGASASTVRWGAA